MQSRASKQELAPPSLNQVPTRSFGLYTKYGTDPTYYKNSLFMLSYAFMLVGWKGIPQLGYDERKEVELYTWDGFDEGLGGLLKLPQ